MGVLWDRSNDIERDNSDNRAIGAKAYFYEANTSTPKAVYQDGGETTAHTQPVTADGYGRWPDVFVPYGSFKVLVTTSGGTELFETDNIPNPAPFDESFELDTTTVLNTGDVFFSLKNGTRDGAVRLNGRTIGDASSSGTERANADCADLFAFLWNNLADGQAAVSGGRGASASADFAAHKRITLPDARACGLFGYDDMGNSAASLLGSAPVVTGGPTTAGSILGANTHTLSATEIPSHTHSFSATTGAAGGHSHTATTDSGGSHTHTGTTASGGSHSHGPGSGSAFGAFFPGTGALASPGGGTAFGSTNTTDTHAGHTHTFTTDSGGSHTHTLTTSTESDHTHSVSGTTGSAGSGGAHNNLARALGATWFIKL